MAWATLRLCLRMSLNEPDSKALIASSGIPVVESRAVRSPQEAGEAAGALLVDHPSVVLKILSRDISHKSDVDGVRLDLATPEAVEAQASAMLARVKELRPSARIDGFSLSPMIRRKDAHELILGISVDPTFGPMVLFGAGGTAVEVLKDTALALLPIDHDGALGLIRQTRISRLLAGYRDKSRAITSDEYKEMLKAHESRAWLRETSEAQAAAVLARHLKTRSEITKDNDRVRFRSES